MATLGAVSEWKQVGENLVKHRGGTIYLRAKVAGKIIRESLEVSDLRIAKIKRDARLDELRTAAKTAPTQIETIGDALEVAAKRLTGKPGLRPNTVRYYDQVFETLRKTLPMRLRASQWTADAAAQWWKTYAAGKSPLQANNGLRLVRGIVAVIIDAGLRRDDPTAKLASQKLKRVSMDSLPSLEIVDKLVASILAQKLRHSEESANMVEFLAWSGMRIGELQALTWEEIGTEWLTVSGGKDGTKNGRSRRVPINSRLAAVIARMRYQDASGPVFNMVSPKAALNGATKRLGIPHLRIHDLRHWFASHAIERGVDILTVSKWLGHLDGGVLAMKTYGHLRDDHSLASASKLG